MTVEPTLLLSGIESAVELPVDGLELRLQRQTAQRGVECLGGFEQLAREQLFAEFAARGDQAESGAQPLGRTRFGRDLDAPPALTGERLTRAVVELIQLLCEVALSSGILRGLAGQATVQLDSFCELSAGEVRAAEALIERLLFRLRQRGPLFVQATRRTQLKFDKLQPLLAISGSDEGSESFDNR